MPESVLHFNGEWRSYQKRILDDLDFHLRDDKLHVVAAPGAGKTTLGIEVISRLNRPSLILCPTNTIKNQWKDRIRNSFLQKKDYGLVSTDIRKPGIRNHIVRLVTDMFNAGNLTVLVGTQAFLGEGWDAPSINSLILSSTVSSYMLSNQMRGRAIRIDKNHPDKVSNIWHLATYDPKFGNYSYDLTQLATRFEGYEAPSYSGNHEIVSGIERVLMPNPLGVPETNIALAKNRDLTRRWWKDALFTG